MGGKIIIEVKETVNPLKGVFERQSDTQGATGEEPSEPSGSPCTILGGYPDDGLGGM